MFSARLLRRVIDELQRAEEMISGQAISRGLKGVFQPAKFNRELWMRQYRDLEAVLTRNQMQPPRNLPS